MVHAANWSRQMRHRRLLHRPTDRSEPYLKKPRQLLLRLSLQQHHRHRPLLRPASRH
jgi:hypothetical protein